MARGIQIGTISIPVSDVSFNGQRNPIAEKSFGHATETSIYGGGVVYTGSFGGAYRPSSWETVIKTFMGGNQATNVNAFATTDVVTVKISDEHNNTFDFTQCAINSVEISCQAGDYAKITAGWIGSFATASTSHCQAATYNDIIPVFYNTTIGGMKVKSFKLNMERPFDQQNFIIGSEYLQSMVQNDNVTISGSFTTSPTEYEYFKSTLLTGDALSAEPASTNKNTIVVDGPTIVFRKPDGTSQIGTITISKMALSDNSASANGRNQFEKTINFKVPVDNSTKKLSFTF